MLEYLTNVINGGLDEDGKITYERADVVCPTLKGFQNFEEYKGFFWNCEYCNKEFDAKKECDQLVAWMPGMLESQKKTVEMRPKFIGTWSRSEQDETGAVRKEAFTFAKDGVLKTAEEKKGLSNEAFKEDWKFVSSGTWDNIADTVYLFVTKESCERQNYSNLKIVDGKKKWVDAKGATYKDSTVAKNRFMTWEELTVGEYKKK